MRKETEMHDDVNWMEKEETDDEKQDRLTDGQK
jgi:hypothetical protein